MDDKVDDEEVNEISMEMDQCSLTLKATDTRTDENERSKVEIKKKKSSSLQEWILYGSVFIVMMVILSIIHALGTLFPYFLDEFGERRAKTAAIQSTFFGVGPCSGLFTGVIIQHYGPKLCGIVGAILFSGGLIASAFASSTTYLLISLGIISALGGPSLLNLSACQAVSLCFEGKSKLIGLSVATSSIGVGAMVYPYLIKVTMESVGVKGTLLVLGGIALNAIPLSVLWSDPRRRTISTLVNSRRTSDDKSLTTGGPTIREDRPNKQDDEEEENIEIQSLISTDNEIEKEIQHNSEHLNSQNNKTGGTRSHVIAKFVETITYKPFLALMLAFTCAIPSVTMFEILLLDVLETSGLTRGHAIELLIVLNATSIPGRLVPGLINKIPRCKSIMSLMLGSIISVIAIMLLIHTYGLAGNVISCILLGASKGILLGCLSVVPLEMLGPARLSTGMGITACVNGIFSTAQGPLHGYLRDVSGSYTITLYIAAGSMMLALLFSSVSMLLQNRVKSRQ